MGRMSRGWDLTKDSWAAVQADRSLLIFPVVSAIAAVIVLAIFFLGGVGVAVSVGGEDGSIWPAVPFLVVGVYLLIVVSQFCSVALAACASKVLDGGEVTFADGMRAARGRLGVILQWSLVQLIVGALISAIQSVLREGVGSLVSSLIGGLANASWSVATFFVIPVLALEGVGPRDAFNRSTSILKEQWGEGITGSASIGLITLVLGYLPAGILIAGGVALVDQYPAPGGVLIALGVIVALVASLLQVTLGTVFRVALYRFATAGEAPGHFTQAQLAQAFEPKRGLFGRKKR
jgi:hypothetical protein